MGGQRNVVIIAVFVDCQSTEESLKMGKGYEIVEQFGCPLVGVEMQLDVEK